MSGELLADQIRPLQSALYYPNNANNHNCYFKARDFKLRAPVLTVPTTGLDEIDNNTYNDLLQMGFKPRYAMNDIFHREDERLKTFDSWPLDWLDKKQLAMSGMFYMGEGDKTKCYFCEVEIGRWEREDQPVPEHLRWSPNCPLLRRRTTNNVPINCEALERLLPPRCNDICGFGEDFEVRRFPAADIAHSSSSSSQNSATLNPEYQEYAIETARLRSFAEWPKLMKQKPAQLAEAGFFYVGVGDHVQCFSCGGGLKDWEENDEPWEQHALWMKECRYVKLIKGDDYIAAVANKFKKTSSNTNEKGESQNVAAATPTISAPTVPSANIISGSKEGELPPGSTSMQQTSAANSGHLIEQNMKSFSSIPEEKLCKICYVSEYNTAFLPCGHVVACAKCASSITKCPLCRKPFFDVMRVYFS